MCLIIINKLFKLLGSAPHSVRPPTKEKEAGKATSWVLPATGAHGRPTAYSYIAPGQLVRGPESRRHSNWREQRATSSLCALWISGPGPVSSRSSRSSLRSLFISTTHRSESASQHALPRESDSQQHSRAARKNPLLEVAAPLQNSTGTPASQSSDSR